MTTWRASIKPWRSTCSARSIGEALQKWYGTVLGQQALRGAQHYYSYKLQKLHAGWLRSGPKNGTQGAVRSATTAFRVFTARKPRRTTATVTKTILWGRC